jgi:hypothetical protein
MEPFGISIGIPVLLEEVFKPSKNLIGLRGEGDFVSIHEVEGVRVGNFGFGKGTSQLGVTEAFMNRGEDFKD